MTENDSDANRLYGWRDIFRYCAVAAFVSLLWLHDSSERVQLAVGILFLLALWCTYQTGNAAREINEAKAAWRAEKDPERNKRAYDRFLRLISQSLWNILKP